MKGTKQQDLDKEAKRREAMAAFINDMQAKFNKHAPLLLEADEALAKEGHNAFINIYESASQEDLAEIAQAQHFKINEIYAELVKRSESVTQILHDISLCKDFIAFSALQKKARNILMAQAMVDKGANIDEMKAQLEGEEAPKIILPNTTTPIVM